MNTHLRIKQRFCVTATFLAMSALAVLAAGDPAKSDLDLSSASVAATGKWQSPPISTSPASVARLKANPLLKVDVTVPPDAEDAGWFMIKLAINGPGINRTESPKWLLEKPPGKAGIDKLTLSWDVSEVVSKLADNPNWFKIELVTQGDHARTISVSNLRAEAASGVAAATTPSAKTGPLPAAPAASTDGPTLYPANDREWPGKGPARSFPFQVGERKAFWGKRQQDQGAIVFVGDSLTGGWKNLAKDFPKYQVANRGVGGDVSRGVLFRFKEDVMALNPKAVVIEIGNNDLTASAAPADMLSNLADILAIADKEKPGIPVVLCSIPPSANPKAPVKASDREVMNAGIRKIAAGRKNTEFCDLYAATVMSDGSPNPGYFVEDKLHLSDGGHTRWAQLLIPLFDKLKLQ